MDNHNVAKGGSGRPMSSPVGSVSLPGCTLTNEGSPPPMNNPYKMANTEGGGFESMNASSIGSTPIAAQPSLAMKSFSVKNDWTPLKSMPVPNKVPGTDYKP